MPDWNVFALYGRSMQNSGNFFGARPILVGMRVSATFGYTRLKRREEESEYGKYVNSCLNSDQRQVVQFRFYLHYFYFLIISVVVACLVASVFLIRFPASNVSTAPSARLLQHAL